jgi:hypothetical protein
MQINKRPQLAIVWSLWACVAASANLHRPLPVVLAPEVVGTSSWSMHLDMRPGFTDRQGAHAPPVRVVGCQAAVAYHCW